MLVSAAILFKLSLPWKDLPSVAFFLVLGLGHFVGYAIQSAGNLLGVVTVRTIRSPSRPVMWLYVRFSQNYLWYELDDLLDARYARFEDERPQAELDRIITLKQIAATMGTCSLVIAALILLRWATHDWQVHPPAALGFAGALALAAILCPLSFIMAAQQTQFVATKTMEERIRVRAHQIWKDRQGTDDRSDHIDDWNAARAQVKSEAEQAGAKALSGKPAGGANCGAQVASAATPSR